MDIKFIQGVSNVVDQSGPVLMPDNFGCDGLLLLGDASLHTIQTRYRFWLISHIWYIMGEIEIVHFVF